MKLVGFLHPGIVKQGKMGQVDKLNLGDHPSKQHWGDPRRTVSSNKVSKSAIFCPASLPNRQPRGQIKNIQDTADKVGEFANKIRGIQVPNWDVHGSKTRVRRSAEKKQDGYIKKLKNLTHMTTKSQVM